MAAIARRPKRHLRTTKTSRKRHLTNEEIVDAVRDVRRKLHAETYGPSD